MINLKVSSCLYRWSVMVFFVANLEKSDEEYFTHFPGNRGGISFDTAGSLSTALLWKMSRRNFQFPHTWNNIEMVIF